MMMRKAGVCWLGNRCRLLWWKKFDVFIWKEFASQEAEIFEQVWALHADEALQKVMRQHGLAYVYYAWVVPVDDRLPCVDRYAVVCRTVSLGKHGGEVRKGECHDG